MRFKVVGRAQATAAAAVLALAASALSAPLQAFEAEIQASGATNSASPDAPAATNRSEPAGEPAAPAPLTASEAAAPAPSAIVLPRPPDASVSVTAADRLPGLMAERLADAGAALLPRLPRKDREALAAFYALGNYQPLWVKDGAWTPAGHALVERLRRAGEDGLDADHYPVPAVRPRTEGDAAAAAVEAELKLSAAAIAYARDARGARIEPSRLSDLITPELALPAADAVLTVLAAAPDAGAALAGYNPPHDGYRALKAKLAEVQSSQAQARLADDHPRQHGALALGAAGHGSPPRLGERPGIQAAAHEGRARRP